MLPWWRPSFPWRTTWASRWPPKAVETDEQFAFLVDRQCEYFQGYLFHRPQPAQGWLATEQAR